MGALIASQTETFHRGGSGEPLVLIHGFSGTRRMWEPLLAHLEGAHEVLAVSLAGHVGGGSLGDGVAASVTALVEAVEADIDGAGFGAAHLVGNSLGGWVALELARRGRGLSVVAVSPAGGWTRGSRAERRLKGLFTRSHRASTLAGPHLERLMSRPRLRRAMLSQAMAHGEHLSPASAAQLVRDTAGCPIYFELMEGILRDGPPDALDGIDCPVLLAWGTKDRILPRRTYAARMRELLPAAEWVDLPGLGHVPMADDPQLVAGVIADFVARVSRRPAAAA